MIPNAIPTLIETANATATDTMETMVAIPANFSMPALMPKPARMPAIPPATLMRTA